MIRIDAIDRLPLLPRCGGHDARSIGVKIDPISQPYLRDHRYGGASLVPATMILEYFAEAAIRFLRGRYPGWNPVLSELKNFRVFRALSVSEDQILEADINLDGLDSIDGGMVARMTIRSRRTNKEGKAIGEKINASCDVAFTKSAKHPCPPPASTLGFREYRFDRSPFYGIYFPTHGPLFQGLTGRFHVGPGDSAIVGQYDAGGMEADFISGNSADFVLSPLGYDCTLQYAVFLSRLYTAYGRLPIGADSIRIHRPHPKTGPCTVVVEKVEIDETILVADIRCFDEAGLSIMEAKAFRFQRSFFSSVERGIFDENLKRHLVAGNE